MLPSANSANKLKQKGKLEEAILAYQKEIDINPNDFNSHYNLGEIFYSEGKLDEAIVCFKQAIALNPQSVWSYQKLGELLQKKRENQEAIKVYSQAIEVDPKFAFAYHNLADILLQKEEYEQSEKYYQQAIKFNPNFVWSYHNLGDTLFRQNKVKEAIVQYRQALKINPEFALSYIHLGNALSQQDQLSEAISCYMRAKELDDKFAIDIDSIKQGLQQSQDAYYRWRVKNMPRQADLENLSKLVKFLPYQPLISIIMPVYNTPEKFLREAIDSVIAQVYPHWELCIADDASPQTHVRKVLEEYRIKEPRIKVIYRSENGHISLASNSALELAKGEYISLLDHDDILTPNALAEVVILLNDHPEADMIYSDEDKLDSTEKLISPFFKPDWSPDTFLSKMYTCHLGTYRRSIINKIGGFRVGYEGAQDYDLVLRFTEKTNQIFHIAKILYHWRIHKESASGGTEAKPYAYQASMKALQDAINRRGETGKIAEVPNFLGHYLVRYQIREYKKVSIIIPTRDLGDVLDHCLESIFTKSVYPHYEVIVIDNGSQEKKTKEILSKWTKKESHRFNFYQLDIPFNFSQINNHAVSKAQGDYLLFLNNDTEVITPDWIEAMVEQAQRASIGAVGVKLLYPNQTIQHVGVVLGLFGIAGHIYLGLPEDTPGYFSNIVGLNNVSAVTGACLMCRREVFEEVGGFDEKLTVAYNDIDLCLKMVEKGYHNIYLPHVVLYHHESQSRGYENTSEKKARWQQEADIMEKRWSKYIMNDPCYSPHLTRERQDFSIRA